MPAPLSVPDQITQCLRDRAVHQQAAADIVANNETLTPEMLAEVQEHTKQFDEISAKMAQLEAVERMNAATAVPVASYGSSRNNEAPAVHVKQAAPANYPGSQMARMAMAVAAGKGDMAKAADFAANIIGDQSVAMAVDTQANSGGSLVPTNMSDEVIDALTPQTVARSLGATSVPLPNGNVNISQDQGGATAYYIGEGQNAKVSETKYGNVDLQAKTMITMVPISKQLIGYSGPKVEKMVLKSMMTAMRVREDLAVLRDDGTNNTPKSFRKIAMDNGRALPFAGDPNDFKAVDLFLRSLVLRLIESNSNMLNPGWGMSPRTWDYLQSLRTSNDHLVYPEMKDGLLKGYPVRKSTLIPSNMGAGSDEAELYFADWDDVMIGEVEGIAMDFSDQAAYVDANGDLQSAYSRNQAIIRLIGANDVGFRHIEGLALGTGVTF